MVLNAPMCAQHVATNGYAQGKMSEKELKK